MLVGEEIRIKKSQELKLFIKPRLANLFFEFVTYMTEFLIY